MYQENPLLVESAPSYIKKLGKGLSRVKDADPRKAAVISDMLTNHVSKGKAFKAAGLTKKTTNQIGPFVGVRRYSIFNNHKAPTVGNASKLRAIDHKINSNYLKSL